MNNLYKKGNGFLTIWFCLWSNMYQDHGFWLVCLHQLGFFCSEKTCQSVCGVIFIQFREQLPHGNSFYMETDSWNQSPHGFNNLLYSLEYFILAIHWSYLCLHNDCKTKSIKWKVYSLICLLTQTHPTLHSTPVRPSHSCTSFNFLRKYSFIYHTVLTAMTTIHNAMFLLVVTHFVAGWTVPWPVWDVEITLLIVMFRQ